MQNFWSNLTHFYIASNWGLQPEKTWCLTSRSAVKNGSLRKIMSTKWSDFKTTEKIRQSSRQIPVIEKRREKYVGSAMLKRGIKVNKYSSWLESWREKRNRTAKEILATALSLTVEKGEWTPWGLSWQLRQKWLAIIDGPFLRCRTRLKM